MNGMIIIHLKYDLFINFYKFPPTLLENLAIFLLWYEHMEKSLMKRIYGAGVDGKWERSRPRISWLDGMIMGLYEKGATIQQAEKCMEDREQWRITWKMNGPPITNN